MQTPPGAWMRIVFPSPGFFLNDPRLTVHVNGWCAYDGSFKTGFDVRFPVAPAHYLLIAQLHTLVPREKRFPVVAHPGHAVEVWLEYSRFWGNLADPRIAQVPLR
jgi:hypothetical protein